MPVITLITHIKAPIDKVFDLSRSIDLHQQSMQHTKEKAVAGKTSGLIEEGETVTWEAVHLFKKRRLTSNISFMDAPKHFRDFMVEGDFKSMHHDHYFRSTDDGTEMKDVFHFESPYGVLGKLFERIYLTAYLKKLLSRRNDLIKQVAEA